MTIVGQCMHFVSLADECERCTRNARRRTVDELTREAERLGMYERRTDRVDMDRVAAALGADAVVSLTRPGTVLLARPPAVFTRFTDGVVTRTFRRPAPRGCWRDD